MADWAGKTLGKIHIDDLVARGGMAEVYVGTHQSFGQVAVKILRGLLERDSEQLARFKRESEVIGELKHANIVQMLDYYVVDETPCLVMEYIPGPSLAAYLKVLRDRKQKLPIGIIANLLVSLASALDYAHDKGMVHRDIKPANVLLRSTSRDIHNEKTLPLDVQPVLTDFGLVRLLDSTMHTTAGSVAGTPAYMSPEQARGEKVDKRTDIYSLGIMLYEMLSGSVPFQADTTFGMLMQHINEHPAPIQGISSDLQALLDRALAKDPAMRYQSAGELANEFMAIFNGQTVSPGTLHIAQLAREAAAASQAAKPPPPETRRNRWTRIGTEVIVVAAVVGALFFVIFRPDTAPPLDPNTPVGRLRFRDFGFYNDRVEISLNSIPAPEQGSHYEAWLLGNNGEQVRDIGRLTPGASGTWRLEYDDPDQINLLRDFDQVQITTEQEIVSAPTGDVVFSSIFPPQALGPVRDVVVSYSEVPDQGPLLQNFWYYQADYVNVAINNNGTVSVDQGLVEALENGEEDTLRKRTEEIINMIVGDASDRYLDYDQDGVIDTVDSDGYGSLPNGDKLGYIQETIQNAQEIVEAPDATPNIRTNSQNIQVCLQNVEVWTNRILELALQLNETPFGAEMEPIVAELSTLGDTLLEGTDADENGSIETISGECGATNAYEYGWDMVDMMIYPGPNRVPTPEP
jgi:serine/threonine protein kinase